MKKTLSQNLWLNRQNKDYFFQKSKKDGYRSRAAYKLLELDKKFKLLKNKSRVVDLGSSPGSWTQVATKIVSNLGIVISIDQNKMDTIENSFFIQSDIKDLLKEENNILKNGLFDLILSDMAPSSTGHKFTDQSKAEFLSFLALEFSKKFLKKGGNFVCKFIRGAGEKAFLIDAKKYYKEVKICKPKASRKDSKEIYIVGLGFSNLHES